MTIRHIAVQRFGFTGDEVETLIDECRDNKETFVFKVLRKWSYKNYSQNREVRTIAFFVVWIRLFYLN